MPITTHRRYERDLMHARLTSMLELDVMITAPELGLSEDPQVVQALALLQEFFPRFEDALCWLNTPHPDFCGRTALAVLKQNPGVVLMLLCNAKDGVPC